MMKAPRRPRGEKSATTIRLLRRQLSIAQATIQALQLDRADKEKVIAGYDVQLAETDDIQRVLRNRVRDQAVELGAERERTRACAQRLSFLEGYYAKSQENRPAVSLEEVSRPSTLFPGNPSQVNAAGRPGNSQNHQNQFARTVPFENGPTGFDEGFGAAVQRQSADHQAHSRQRPVEHVKVTTNSNEWNANADGSPIRGAGR